MQDKPTKANTLSPADIAREAFRRLGANRIAPTPEAYREIYNEIAGAKSHSSAESVLSNFAARLHQGPGNIAGIAHRLSQAAALQDWQHYNEHLDQLIVAHLLDSPGQHKPKNAGDEPALARRISAPINESISAASTNTAGTLHEAPQVRMLRDMLIRTLTLAVVSLLQGAPDLAEESERLADSVKEARTEQDLTELSTHLKQLCFKIELKSGDMGEEHDLLLRLFKLLLDNVHELLEDDTWLNGQISLVQNMLSGPLTHEALTNATRNLKEVIYKQGLLKHNLNEAKATVKNMMLTFMDRLGSIVTSTGIYHEKIDGYTKKISQATDIHELNDIMQDIMHDTRMAQTEALRSRDDILAARQEVQNAEMRIAELETKLGELSELVREDQLTGSLNRRGLDDVFEREIARSERQQSPLCIAMLDLDDFKKINDIHGHGAGDDALIHLVRVVKDTLRAMDVIARFGGEEFLIVLPDTTLDGAMKTITRVQRELTKRIFMYNQQRLLMTFSAGLALHRPGENQAAMIERADAALYQAKNTGKNRVITAP